MLKRRPEQRCDRRRPAARGSTTLAVLTTALLMAFGGAPPRGAYVQAAGGLATLPDREFVVRPSAAPAAGQVMHVPADFPTIQAGVDAARPGDMVFVARGVYHEAVVVRTPRLTIRGEDRNGTVLDGQSKLGNAFLARADNVVIENLTAHHYLANGFYWSGVSGYRGSYLTAFDNGATASTPTAQRMASSTTTTSREIRAPDSTSASASHATPSSHRSGPN